VDLSVNGVRFFTRGQSIGLDVLIYYCLQFSMRLDLFLPLAYLLAMLKTLFDLNSRLELVALQTAGLSRKQLLVPFCGFAMFLTLVSYANHEWLAPSAVKDINAFKRSKSKKTHLLKTVQAIPLDDGSELVYRTFNANTNEFFDVFWIRSPKDIWSMKSLSFTNDPIGHFTDHLIRTPEGLLEKVESRENHLFSDMPITRWGIPGEIVPFEGRSLSTLFRESNLPTPQQSTAQTHLHRKLALPLLPLLALLAISPFAMTFSRQKKALPLVGFSLFGFAIFMTLYDSLLILGENRLASPIAAMWLPIFAAFALFTRRFWKLR
jgi:lipopolysaccharide export LptBFGC system permease protein LptF